MNIEGPARGNSQPVDWVDLVAGIRVDDKEAILRLENIFQGGIRFFLLRALGQDQLQRRQREVFSLVIKNIKDNSVDDPNRLASHVLAILQKYISSQTT